MLQYHLFSNVMQCIGKAENHTNGVMRMEKSTLSDLGVVKNIKKKWKCKSPSKKTTIEVQLVCYAPLVVLISWICTNWSIWLQPCTINLFSIYFYIICSILWYFHCLLIVVPHVNKNWNRVAKAPKLPWLDHLLTNWGLQMHMYFAFYAPSIEIDFSLGVIVYSFCYKLNAIDNYFQYYFGFMHRISCLQIGIRNVLFDKFLSFPCYF